MRESPAHKKFAKKQPVFECFGCGETHNCALWGGGHYGYARRHCDGCRGQYMDLMEAGKSAVAREIRFGRLPRAKTLKCVDCGEQATGWEHRDYRKPIDVVPTCHSCNKLRGPGKWNSFHDRFSFVSEGWS